MFSQSLRLIVKKKTLKPKFYFGGDSGEHTEDSSLKQNYTIHIDVLPHDQTEWTLTFDQFSTLHLAFSSIVG